MLSFDCDYIAGAHPDVLKKLVETNMESLSGYGSDFYCNSAREKIKKACDCENADVYFLAGGTQANLEIISSLLDSYEGVISADTAHITSAVIKRTHYIIRYPFLRGARPPPGRARPAHCAKFLTFKHLVFYEQ